METRTVILTLPVFKRLQGYVEPLVDTADSALTRIFDAFDASNPKPRMAVIPAAQEPTHFTTSRGVKMPIGLKLTASYKNKSRTATVTASGIEYNGKTYDDPSSAAVQAKIDCGASKTAASTNGWEFWMMPASVPGKVTSIDQLRKR